MVASGRWITSRKRGREMGTGMAMYSISASVLVGRTVGRDEFRVEAENEAEAERIGREKCEQYTGKVLTIEVFRGHFPASYWHR